MAVPVQFGMNVAVLPGTPHGEPADAAELAGAKWVRMVFFFSRHFNMNEKDAFAYYDRLVNKYAAQGISCLFIFIQDTFWGNAPWSSGGWDVYAENFGNVAAKIAAHFKGKPVAYQIWNEPDLAAGSSIQLTPQNYALILNSATTKIKAADPNATVIMAGLAKSAGESAKYVQEVQKAIPGQKLPVDGISVHFYGQYVGDKRPTDDEHPGGVFSSLADSMQIFKSGVPNLPVWITEIGIVNHDDHFRWNDNQNRAIAKYIENTINYIQRNHSSWVRAVTWFAWGDVMENGGMVDLSGNKKHQYHAFVNTVRNLKVEASPYFITPTANINMRQADYTKFANIGRVDNGAPLTVLEPPYLAKAKMADPTEDQWICVQNPLANGQAWVAAWLMEVASESPFTIRRKGGGFINLRNGDMTQLSIGGAVTAGDKLTVLESPSIAFEKIRVAGGDKAPDHLKNWIYVENTFGQRAWVAAWFTKVHADSKTPLAIVGADAATPTSTQPTTTPVASAPTTATATALNADQLAAILSEEMKKFAGDGDVAGQILLPISDDKHKTYAISVIGQGNVTVRILARILGDKVVIEADVTKALVTNLKARGISRGQIVLVYAGEARPE